MTREELREYVEELESRGEIPYYVYSNLIDCIDTLEQEPTTKNDLGVDCIPRIEVIDYLCKHCPDDGECFKDCDEIKHLRNIPSVTLQEPFINKPCVSIGVCHEDKIKVLDKIRTLIGKAWYTHPKNRYEEGLKDQALKDKQIIDKYIAESRGEINQCDIDYKQGYKE